MKSINPAHRHVPLGSGMEVVPLCHWEGALLVAPWLEPLDAQWPLLVVGAQRAEQPRLLLVGARRAEQPGLLLRNGLAPIGAMGAWGLLALVAH
jgi:hypothetical protein